MSSQSNTAAPTSYDRTYFIVVIIILLRRKIWVQGPIVAGTPKVFGGVRHTDTLLMREIGEGIKS